MTTLKKSNSKMKMAKFAQRKAAATRSPSLMAIISIWIAKSASIFFPKCKSKVPWSSRNILSVPLWLLALVKDTTELTLIVPWGRGIQNIWWCGAVWWVVDDPLLKYQLKSAIVGATSPKVPFTHRAKWLWNSSRHANSLKVSWRNTMQL